MAKQKTFVQNNNHLAVACCRYTSNAQNKARIESQRKAAETYAEAHGFPITKNYADETLSGASDDRPQFQLTLTAAMQLRPAALIVRKTDRIAVFLCYDECSCEDKRLSALQDGQYYAKESFHHFNKRDPDIGNNVVVGCGAKILRTYKNRK